jgi:NAD(P)-dependent dehydrogenase (short-subunit alcohol dehydrogenase family)
MERRPRSPPRGPAKAHRGGDRRRDARRADPAACEALVSRALESFGSVDILVANAGIGLYGSIADGEPEDWRLM